MSITAIEMIKDAFRASNVIDEDETPSAEQGVTGLRILNQMMASWHGEGIQLGWATAATQQTVLPLDVHDEKAVKFNLAVEIAIDSAIEPPAVVLAEAGRLYKVLEKRHRLTVEQSVTHLPGMPTSANILTG